MANIKIKKWKIILVIFIAFYIPSLVHWVGGKNIQTSIIRSGTIEEAVNCEAYVLRDEIVFPAPFDGIFIPDAEEGDRIPAGFRLATVYNGTASEYIDKLKEIERKILERRNEKVNNLEIFSLDIKKIENEINAKVRLIIEEINMNRLQQTKKIKDDIDSLIEKKALILGERGFAGADIKNLEEERGNLKQKIELNREEIVSQTAGTLSYLIDGYEEKVNYSNINELTPEKLEEIKDAQVDGSFNNTSRGEPFVKIIKGIDYYLAAVLDKNKALLFEQDKDILIRINDLEGECMGKIIQIKTFEDGKCIIVLKVDRYMDRTTAFRKLNMDLVKASYQGLKVPVKSLINLDREKKTAEIAAVRANIVRIIQVDIIGINKDFAVLQEGHPIKRDSIKMYERYVMEPVNIEEGQIIN